jgi:FKBP-type peptidyl-prolyl cis-trans isomerase
MFLFFILFYYLVISEMYKGEICKVDIPPEYGYGEDGLPPQYDF